MHVPWGQELGIIATVTTWTPESIRTGFFGSRRAESRFAEEFILVLVHLARIDPIVKYSYLIRLEEDISVQPLDTFLNEGRHLDTADLEARL